jgi:antitoxin CptB
MHELAKLKWQCRRGCLELDLLLSQYLETTYSTASNNEKLHFKELLFLEDSELLGQLKIFLINPVYNFSLIRRDEELPEP